MRQAPPSLPDHKIKINDLKGLIHMILMKLII